ALGIALGIAWMVGLPTSGAAAGSAGPSRVACIDKTFPNLAGQNGVILTLSANGSYSVTYESYGPAKTKQGLRCLFDANPLIFSCTTPNASWALIATKTDERSIDGAAKVTDAHVYKIEAVKTPEGEPQTQQVFRFPLAACKAAR